MPCSGSKIDGQFRHFFTDIGLWWFFREAFYCCLLTFTLNTAAYQAEIYRGAIRAIPHDEIDAGKALGFTGWQIKDGVLQGNTDLGSRSTSIMSIGDREKWRDFQLEMEFSVTKGDPVLHARLGASVNNTTIKTDAAPSSNNARNSEMPVGLMQSSLKGAVR